LFTTRRKPLVLLLVALVVGFAAIMAAQSWQADPAHAAQGCTGEVGVPGQVCISKVSTGIDNTPDHTYTYWTITISYPTSDTYPGFGTFSGLVTDDYKALGDRGPVTVLSQGGTASCGSASSIGVQDQQGVSCTIAPGQTYSWDVMGTVDLGFCGVNRGEASNTVSFRGNFSEQTDGRIHGPTISAAVDIPNRVG
jgi:hypothetical protein